MSIEAINSIREAERESLNIIRKSGKDASAMLFCAKSEAEKIKSKIIDKARNDGNNIIKEAENFIEEESGKITEKYKILSDTMIAKANLRKNDAVRFMVDFISEKKSQIKFDI